MKIKSGFSLKCQKSWVDPGKPAASTTKLEIIFGKKNKKKTSLLCGI